MSTSWNNRVALNTTFTNRSTVTTAWDQRVDYLLKEDSFYLLLENGFKIILSGISSTSTPWTDRTAI